MGTPSSNNNSISNSKQQQHQHQKHQQQQQEQHRQQPHLRSAGPTGGQAPECASWERGGPVMVSLWGGWVACEVTVEFMWHKCSTA